MIHTEEEDNFASDDLLVARILGRRNAQEFLYNDNFQFTSTRPSLNYPFYNSTHPYNEGLWGYERANIRIGIEVRNSCVKHTMDYCVQWMWIRDQNFHY